MDVRGSLVLAATLFGLPTSAAAAEYPAHAEIDVLIVSDGVNPHGLPPASLTEPGELEAALLQPDGDWGLSLGAVDEVSSQCVDEALDRLGAGDVDVVIYFAHRAAQTCDGRSVQAQLTALMQRHLQERGGVVVFHHGIFQAAGKTQILELLGGTANRFEWFPVEGQAVINVAPRHFVTTHEVDYEASTSLSSPELGVPMATYPSFTNVPDERYPELTALVQPGETRIPLFASDYDGAQLLGYDLHRPGWTGHVIMYQPGEHQPHALADVDGPNRQILSNAIYYAATGADGGSVNPPDDPPDVPPDHPPDAPPDAPPDVPPDVPPDGTTTGDPDGRTSGAAGTGRVGTSGSGGLSAGGGLEGTSGTSGPVGSASASATSDEPLSPAAMPPAPPPGDDAASQDASASCGVDPLRPGPGSGRLGALALLVLLATPRRLQRPRE